MKNWKTYLLALMALALISCGGDNKSKNAEIKAKMPVKADPYDAWETTYGVGPIAAFELPAEIDQELVAKGMEIYNTKCTACHKVEKKFIGPSPLGILSRRNPAWIMNMILDPAKMVAEDPIAKKLLIEYNGSPMANQNLTEEDARAVLEYFRTLD